MPTIVIPSSIKDAHLNSQYPSQNYGNLDHMWVGRYNIYSTFRSLIQFDIFTIPEGVSITNAIMELYINSVYNSYIVDVVTPYRVMSDWDEYTVTWATSPPIDDHSFGYPVNVFGINLYKWDITSLVKGWYTGLYPNYGMLLKSLETRDFEAKSIASREYGDITKRPQLTITYEATNLVSLYGRLKKSESEGVTTSDTFKGGTIYDTSEMSMYTFFAKNNGTNPALIKLQISPDGINWVDNGDIIAVNPGEIKAAVPYIYSHFVRAAYKSMHMGQSTSITIWYQSHI